MYKFLIIKLNLIGFMIFSGASLIAREHANKEAQILKISKKKLSFNNFPVKKNNVVLGDYGGSLAPNRKCRITFTLTGFTYTCFLARIQTLELSEFAQAFFDSRLPFLNPGWTGLKLKMRQELEIASVNRNLEPDALFDSLLQWTKKQSNLQEFKNIYTAENLKNNIYKMPKGYNQQIALDSFRLHGAILQMSLVRYSIPSKKSKKYFWLIDNDRTRIFPCIPEITYLTHYYQYFVNEGGAEIKLPPFIDIKLERVPSGQVMLRDVLTQFWKTVAFNFNFVDVGWTQRVGISEACLNYPISKNKDKPTQVNLIFYSFNSFQQKVFYISKPMNLFVSA